LYARYEEALEPMAGVFPMLDGLERPACVASSSVCQRIEISVKLTGPHDRLAPTSASATMVPRGKPAPDLFLYAARAMGADPADCIVVEDSPAGVMAAREAGMKVVAFTGGGHVGPARLEPQLAALGPDAVVGDMQNLSKA